MLGLHPEVKKRAKNEQRFTIQFRLDGRDVPTKNIRGEDSFHCCYEFAGDISKEEGEAFLEMYIGWLKEAEKRRKAKREVAQTPPAPQQVGADGAP